MADRNANIIISVRGNADAETRKLAGAFRDMSAQARAAGATQEQAERQTLAHATAQARLAQALGQTAQAERIYIAALSQVNTESASAIRAQTQLVNIQNRGAGIAAEFGSAFKSNLLGILGPLALVTGGIAALRAGLNAAEEGFKLNAQIDATTQSIALQLQGVRSSGIALQQANAYATRYKLTQEDMTDAIAASIPVTRASKAPLDEILGVFDRLRIRQPGKTFGDAARALGELQAGQVVSLEKIFNVLPDDANRMKKEIQGGADAVQVLSTYLTKSGIGMDAVATRATGASGKLKDLAISGERLSRAFGGENGGVGATIVDARIAFNERLANVLSRDVVTAFNQSNRAAGVARVGREAYNAAIANGATAEQAASAAEQAYADAARRTATVTEIVSEALRQTTIVTRLASAGTSDLADRHVQLSFGYVQTSAAIQEFNADLQQNAAQAQIGAAQSTILKQAQGDIAETARLASLGMLGEGDQAIILAKKLGIAQDAAQLLINANLALAAGKALVDFRAEERGGKAPDDLKSQQTAQAGFDRVHDAYLAEEKRKHQAIVQLRLASAKTDAQKIAILQQELRGTTDVVERLQLQTQIVTLKNSAAKSHTSELGKQLNLEERIADSKEKQLRSAIDARLAINDDASKRILEADESRRAQITANNAKDPRIRALAQLAADRIPLEQAKRALDIRESSATAGGALRDGKIIQGDRGGGLPGLPGGGGALPGLPGLPTSVGGVPIINVKVFLDSGEIAARVIVDLGAGANQAINTGAGR